ncbi:hypothetical protein CI238_10277 [Colletotrichum incanum]|uniref:Uncharacterized protein n=1 Tax=Colletotrichum incanum TaxID=1573173 RepID=A0A161XRY6_COLIC|nr:hypothetical protein CI238_10277 [Colletotrichum incanum]OHW96936.1 hypothetical protein CSPAE12_04526 [Colletotrichum incanum]
MPLLAQEIVVKTGYLPQTQMAISPIDTTDSSNQVVLGGSFDEPKSLSDSALETCAGSGIDKSPTDLASQQHRGLDGLRDKRDGTFENIRSKFARQRDQSQQYFDSKRALIRERYRNGACCWTFKFFFQQSLRRELEDIYNREKNGMVVLLEGERIERGLVERKYEDWERNYIRECRKEWAKKYPATPFWYDRSGTVSCLGDSAGSCASGHPRGLR